MIAVLPIAATVGSAVDCDCTVVVNSQPIFIVGCSVGNSDVGKTGIGLVFFFVVDSFLVVLVVLVLMVVVLVVVVLVVVVLIDVVGRFVGVTTGS